MRFFDFEVVIEKEAEDEGYRGPGLPGCFGNGAMIEATRQSAREAFIQNVTVFSEKAPTLPQCTG